MLGGRRCRKKIEQNKIAQESFSAGAHLELSTTAGSLEVHKVAGLEQAGDAALEPAGPFFKKCFLSEPAGEGFLLKADRLKLSPGLHQVEVHRKEQVKHFKHFVLHLYCGMPGALPCCPGPAGGFFCARAAAAGGSWASPSAAGAGTPGCRRRSCPKVPGELGHGCWTLKGGPVVRGETGQPQLRKQEAAADAEPFVDRMVQKKSRMGLALSILLGL